MNLSPQFTEMFSGFDSQKGKGKSRGQRLLYWTYFDDMDLDVHVHAQ